MRHAAEVFAERAFTLLAAVRSEMHVDYRLDRNNHEFPRPQPSVGHELTQTSFSLRLDNVLSPLYHAQYL